MGQSIYPPSGGSIIKSIQRGTAASAGTVTISAVDVNKSVVTSFSNGSSGVVGLSGNTTISYGGTGAGGTNTGWGSNSGGTISANISISGGTNTLVAAVSGAYLSSSTQITVDGPCIWQVVEYS